MINAFAKRMANASISQWIGLIKNPWKIEVIFSNMPVLPNIEALKRLFSGITDGMTEKFLLEFLRNDVFFNDIDRKMVAMRMRRSSWERKYEFIYLVVRFAQPETVIETGVFDGQSSSVILQAMEDNGSGTLISIDLPASESLMWSTHAMMESTLPHGCGPGWAIPDRLRKRHRLMLGDSKKLLPQVLAEYPKIDIFFHDSMHTFDYQYFEFCEAWPHIKDGGLLMSDDILWSPAFHRFCREKHKNGVCLTGPAFGAIRK